MEERGQFRPGMQGPEAAPNFEAMMQRELGARPEEALEMGGAAFRDRIEQARRLFQQRQFEEGRDVLRGVGRQFREMRELRERDPERFKLQRRIIEMDGRSAELGQKVRRAENDDAKKKAAEELKSLLNELFDLRQQERESTVQQLERELKEVREALEKRKARRNEIIQHRIEQLTGKAELMEW